MGATLLMLGCTSSEALAPGAHMALMRTTNEDTIRLPAEGGGTVEIGPNATILVDGTPITAKDFYWNETGIFRSNGDFISTWDGIGRVTTEQINGAATVAVTATVAVVVVIVAALLKSAPSGNGGSGGAHPTASSPPPVPRSAPNPPVSDPTASEVALQTADLLVRAPFAIAAHSPDEPDVDPAIPLFSRDARRRSNVRVLARLEGAACWPGGGASGDCVVGGARVGVRLADMFELTGGIRAETATGAGVTTPLAVFGAMLHGEVPSLHWFALALGASVAFDAQRAHVIPTFGVRFRPVRGLWLGIVPIQPVYATETGGWNMASGLEVTGEL